MRVLALARGYLDVSVLDLSSKALESAKARLGERAAAVHWLAADITRASREFGGAFQKVGSLIEMHSTPWGAEQKFVYCHCRWRDS